MDCAVRSPELWERVSQIVDRASSMRDLQEHKLQLIAAVRWRAAGRPVPREVGWNQRLVELTNLMLPSVLAEVRAAFEGRIVLLKGQHAAARYPQPTKRPFYDLDLLVDDAEGAHQALIHSGFREVGDPSLYVDIHHLRPLVWPDLPVPIEIHRSPKWVEGLEPPPIAEVLATLVESEFDGIHALPAAQDAVVLAVHAWAHEPLRTLLDLVDIAAASAEARPEEIRDVAKAWGVDRIWRTTERAIDAVFYEGKTPLPLRIWARNIVGVRGRTVLESHLENWLAPFSGLPLRLALRTSATSIVGEFRPAYGESWESKRARTRFALRNAFTRRALHHELLRDEGLPISPHDLTHNLVRPDSESGRARPLSALEDRADEGEER